MFKAQWLKPTCILIALVVVTLGAFGLHLSQKNKQALQYHPSESVKEDTKDKTHSPQAEPVKDDPVPLNNVADSAYGAFIESCKQVQNDTSTPSTIAFSNDKTVEFIQAQYHSSLLIARGHESFVCDGLTEYANDEQNINTAILSITRSLEILPVGFLAELNKKEFELCFVVVGSLQNSTGILQVIQENKIYLLIDSNKTVLQTTIQKAIISSIATKIRNDVLNGVVTVSMHSFNPNKFSYGTFDKSYLYSSTNKSTGCFINSNAQQSVQSDVCEIFKKLMNEPNQMKSIPKTTLMYQKTKACAQALCKAYPSLKAQEAFVYFMNE